MNTEKMSLENENQPSCLAAVSKRLFLCDCCGKEKTGIKHKMYDENWNIQRGCYECDECYSSRLDSQLTDEEQTVY